MTVAGADVSTHTVARSPTTRRSNGPSRSVITHDLPSPGRAPQSGDSPAPDGPCDDRVEAAGVGAAPVHPAARRARRELLVGPAGQRAEVDVEHEAGAGDALRPRYRQHLDQVTVHPQLADLGPGYPQRLDDVHRAGPAGCRYRDLAAPVGGRQQEPQRWRDEYPHHFTTPNHSRQSSP